MSALVAKNSEKVVTTPTRYQWLAKYKVNTKQPPLPTLSKERVNGNGLKQNEAAFWATSLYFIPSTDYFFLAGFLP